MFFYNLLTTMQLLHLKIYPSAHVVSCVSLQSTCKTCIACCSAHSLQFIWKNPQETFTSRLSIFGKRNNVQLFHLEYLRWIQLYPAKLDIILKFICNNHFGNRVFFCKKEERALGVGEGHKFSCQLNHLYITYILLGKLFAMVHDNKMKNLTHWFYCYNLI